MTRPAKPSPPPLPLDRVLMFEAPIRTVSEANTRGHWFRRYTRGDGQKGAVLLLCRTELGVRPPAPPLRVRLTRIAPRVLDTDNLVSAFKAIRDAVAFWLDVSDGDSCVTWDYAQERGAPKAYAIRVEILPPTGGT